MSVSCVERVVDGGGGRSGKPGLGSGASPGSADVSDGSTPSGGAHHRPANYYFMYTNGAKQKAAAATAGRGRRALAAGATPGAI